MLRSEPQLRQVASQGLGLAVTIPRAGEERVCRPISIVELLSGVAPGAGKGVMRQGAARSPVPMFPHAARANLARVGDLDHPQFAFVPRVARAAMDAVTASQSPLAFRFPRAAMNRRHQADDAAQTPHRLRRHRPDSGRAGGGSFRRRFQPFSGLD